MKDEQIKNAVELYFKTLEDNGRMVSEKVNPKQKIIDQELQFISYLDPDDLNCMFCFNSLQVIVIDYRIQRPVYGCLKCRFTKGMQKIKWLNHCADCGDFLDLNAQELKDQRDHLDQDNVLSVCHKCCGNGNIIDIEDMKNVHKKEFKES